MFNRVLKTLYSTLHTTTAAVAAVGVAGIVGLAYVTNPATATLNATAFNTSPQTINSGTLSLTLAAGVGQTQTSAGFTTTISSMIPGDTQYRYIDYTQAATNATATSPALQITDGASTLLTADTIRGLSVTVTNCSVPWTFTLGTSTQSCTGTQTTALSSTPLVTLKSATALGAGFQLTSGAVSHLQFALVLPAGISETTTNGGAAVVAGNPFVVTSTSGTGSLATYTVASTASLTTGEQIVITGSSVPAYNGTYILTVASGTTFTTTSTGTGASSGTTANLPSVQNLSSTVTWSVAEAQRAATQNNG